MQHYYRTNELSVLWKDCHREGCRKTLFKKYCSVTLIWACLQIVLSLQVIASLALTFGTYESYVINLGLLDIWFIWHLNIHLFPQISASDPDLGSSGRVRYSLIPDFNDHYKSFSIDPLNGTIYTTASFDREKLGLYKLTVRATDQPSSGQGR